MKPSTLSGQGRMGRMPPVLSDRAPTRQRCPAALRRLLRAACALLLAPLPLWAGTAPEAAAAWALDPESAGQSAIMETLAQDLAPLLAAAEYRRDPDQPDAPAHALTSVRRIASVLRSHEGLAYVLLTERSDDPAQVRIRRVHVVQGPAAADGAGALRAQGTPANPGKAAMVLDLRRAPTRDDAMALGSQLARLVPPGPGFAPVSLDDVVGALGAPGQVAFVVLAEPAGDAAVTSAAVFVVPDVLHISIRDDGRAAKTPLPQTEEPAAPAPSGDTAAAPQTADEPGASSASGEDEPEVQLVPSADGGPPLVKFRFDPRKYDITEQE